jgi:hypothetical protein
VIRSGAVKLHIGQRFPLQNVADAHLALEQRRTIGATGTDPLNLRLQHDPPMTPPVSTSA